jgi:hypothetical protein
LRNVSGLCKKASTSAGGINPILRESSAMVLIPSGVFFGFSLMDLGIPA